MGALEHHDASLSLSLELTDRKQQTFMTREEGPLLSVAMQDNKQEK